MDWRRGTNLSMKHGLELYEEATRLHEEHARHAREHGREDIAKRAERRAENARIRAALERRLPKASPSTDVASAGMPPNT